MQCQVWKADLSIGGMTKCTTCSQPFSRTYAMMLRSSHTFRPWQPRSLTSSANSSDEARLDISAHGFWKRRQRAFFDVRVFNPSEKSHLNQKLRLNNYKKWNLIQTESMKSPGLWILRSWSFDSQPLVWLRANLAHQKQTKKKTALLKAFVFVIVVVGKMSLVLSFCTNLS